MSEPPNTSAANNGVVVGDKDAPRSIKLVAVLLEDLLNADFDLVLRPANEQLRKVVEHQLELVGRLPVETQDQQLVMRWLEKVLEDGHFRDYVPFFNILLQRSVPLFKLVALDHRHRSRLLQSMRKLVHLLSGLKLTTQAALEETAKLCGTLIGALLRADVDSGSRSLAEAFLAELGALLPTEPQNSDTCQSALGPPHLLCPTVVPLYGTLAFAVQDEPITELCMSALMAQFDKGAYGLRTRLFFEQFNLLAGGTSVACFNKSIDVYTRMYRDYERDDYLLGEVAKGLVGLVTTCLRDRNKLEVLVVSLMQGFVDKGLAILPEYGLKEPPRVLEYLLAPIALALENVQIESLPRSTLIEIFQEFWFILIYFGYQPKLRWSDGWRKHIAVIAHGTPVLVKEVRSASERILAQSLLSKNVNPQLKAHLITLMPNCVQHTSALSIAHCLWLLAFYHSESFKLHVGHFGDLFRYVESEAVEKLALFPFVEDIAVTLVQQWLQLNNRPDLLLALTIEIAGHLGHRDRRVHDVAVSLCRYVVLKHDDIVLGEQGLWTLLVHKAFLLRRNVEGPLDRLCLCDEFIQDPVLVVKALEDVKQLIADYAARCYAVYPVAMHLTMRQLLDQFDEVNFKLFLAALIHSCRPETSLTLQSVNDFVQPPLEDLDVRALTLREAGRLVLLLTRASPSVEQFLPRLLAKIHHVFRAFRPCRSPLKERIDFGPSQIEGEEDVGGEEEERLCFFLVLVRFLNLLTVQRARLNVPFVRSLGDFLVELTRSLRQVASMRPLYLVALLGSLGLTALNCQRLLPLDDYDRQRLTMASYGLLTFYYEQLSSYDLFSDGTLVELVLLFQDIVHLLEQNTTHLRLPVKKEGPPESRLIKLNSVLLTMARHELQKLRVLAGQYEAAEPVGFQRMLYDLALDISPVLGLRFHERFLAQEPFKSVPRTSYYLALLQSSDVIDALLEDCSSEDDVPANALMLAPPLSPIAALQVFRKCSRQPAWLNYAMRSLEHYSPNQLFFYTPQVVQIVRHNDRLGFIRRTIMHIAAASSLFAHQVIWNCQANLPEVGGEGDDGRHHSDAEMDKLDLLIRDIVATMGPHDLAYYQREFAFFQQVTGISGLLKPFIKREKWEKKQKIDEELRKICVGTQDRLYLPSNPESVVVGIDYESGRPLQSAAKAPFMATFKVIQPSPHDEKPPVATRQPDHDNDHAHQDSSPLDHDDNQSSDIQESHNNQDYQVSHDIRHEHDNGNTIWQSAIFKVGDDCRQDVMTLQLVSMCKQIWQRHHAPLFVYAYRVVATNPGCGVIEVIPRAISRDQLGRERVNNLHLYFVERHGPENGPSFARARINFIRSLAAYSLITYLFAIRDRHNGNIMIQDDGHILHIDFGFILDLCPGGIAFEKSPFKLTAEMITVLGGQQGPWFALFKRRLLQGFLALRPHWRSLVRLASLMDQARLPCFDAFPTGTNIDNLRARFDLGRSDADLVAFVDAMVYRSTENMRTAMYDSYQLSRNGIPY